MTFINGDFSQTIPAAAYYNGVFNQMVPDARYASESKSGAKRRKPNLRFIPPTAYTFVREAWQQPMGNMYYNPPGTVYTYSGCVQPFLGGSARSRAAEYLTLASAPQSVSANMRAKALLNARLKLKSQDFNVGVAFGELAETAALFENTASRLLKSYRAFRRGDYRGVCRALNINFQKPSHTAADMMLSYSYGVVPLLSDLYGAAKALETSPADHWMVTAKGGSKQKVVSTVVRAGVPSSSGDPNYCEAQVSAECGSFVRIDAIPSSPGLIKMVQLGITNPASIAWELVPFSFVVDWAFLIGDYLSSLDACVGFDVAGYSQSDYVKLVVSAKGRPIKYYYVNNWAFSYEKVSVNRAVSSVVPFPILSDLRGKATGRRLANGAALLRSLGSDILEGNSRRF